MTCPFDPPPGHRDLQTTGPAVRVRSWDGSTPWVITRHADQRDLLRDPRVSADVSHAAYPHTNAAARDRQEPVSFLNIDAPEHTRQRRMVIEAFTPRRAEALRPVIQGIVDRLIDDLLAGPKPVDLVAEFALPVPSLVICELLGVPYADHEFFQRNSLAMVNTVIPPEQALAGEQALVDYIDRLIDVKLAAGRSGDLVSTLVFDRMVTGELTRQEVAMTGMLLLFTGHETTANMITLGTLALLRHPDQLAAVRSSEDPRAAVEELLRYLTIPQAGRRRVALADLIVGDVVIRAGEGMIFPNDLGNRDPRAFPDPGTLDVGRDTRGHLAFGAGPHACLGSALARVELQVVYGTLYRRIPDLQLAEPMESLRYKHDGSIYGVYELPVTW